MSKIEQARKVYAANVGKSRLEIISIFQRELGLARGTASGYHDSIKKAAQKVETPVVTSTVVVKTAVPSMQNDTKIVQSTVEKTEYKRPVAGPSKPLHNFTTAEMLEVLDPDTRKDIEKLLAVNEA